MITLFVTASNWLIASAPTAANWLIDLLWWMRHP